MAEPYLAISRKFRPQRFSEVVGQERTVVSLQNALRFHRIAHAYLFSGTRGCGKTTLARLFAKALNCTGRKNQPEPCNTCDSCRTIGISAGLDVVEIDGASHRGIDDIRQLRDSAGYSASGGGFKIYIIDEVHMLTKEAFNALLKTLEEPPSQIKFLFATTELHRVPLTIQSRCQRFALELVDTKDIVAKLERILNECSIPFESEALALIALRAQGSMRDAESILDQVICFAAGRLELWQVRKLLGVLDPNWYFELDGAVKTGALTCAFSLAKRICAQGIDFSAVIEGLLEHYRNHLLGIVLCAATGGDQRGEEAPLSIPQGYEMACKTYSQEQCLHILDTIGRYQPLLKTNAQNRVHLELLLVEITQSSSHISWNALWAKLKMVEALIHNQTIIRDESKPTIDSNPSSAEGTLQAPHLGAAEPAQAHGIAVQRDESEALEIPQKYLAQKNADENLISPQTGKEVPAVQEIPSDSTSAQAAMITRQRTDTLVQFAAVEFGAKIELTT